MVKSYKATELPWNGMYAYEMPDWIGFSVVKVSHDKVYFENNHFPTDIKDIPASARFHPITNSNIIFVK